MESETAIQISAKGSVVAWDESPGSSMKGSTEELLSGECTEGVELGLQTASNDVSPKTNESRAHRSIMELEGTSEQIGYVPLLEELHRSSAQLPGGFLDYRLKQFTEAFDSAGIGSVIFTSQPLKAMMTKKYFIMVLAIFLAAFLYLTITWTTFVASLWNCDYGAFGVIGLPLNQSTPGIFSPGAEDLVLGVGLLKGTRVLPGTQHPTVSQGKLIFSTIEEAADGWYLVVSKSWKETLDLEQIKLEGYKELGKDPLVFSRDGWGVSHPKTIWILHECLVRAEACGPGPGSQHLANISSTQEVLAFTFRSTDFFFTLISLYIMVFGLAIQIFFAAVLKWTGYSINVSGVWCSILVILCLVAASMSRDPVSIFLYCGFSISVFILAFGIWFLERHWFWVWCCDGMFNLALGIVNFGFQKGGTNLLLLGLLQVSTSVCVAVMRERLLRRARHLIKPDLEKYEQVWAELRDSEQGLDLVTLKVTVAEMQPDISDLRQRTTTVPDLNYVISGSYGLPGPSGTHPLLNAMLSRLPSNSSTGTRRKDPKTSFTPVGSLDQLFTQARALDRILRQKVVGWALESRGLFATKSSGDEHGSLAPARIAMESMVREDTGLTIKWGGVKKPARAIEKVCRSYGGDCSRLLDICRQSCVFENVKDLQLCLQVLRTDSEVNILRLKNRLDPGYNASQTGGYRDVALNLQIRTDLTRRLGVEDHICEVQLILKPFFGVRSDKGHSRYVYFRNLRGE